MGNADARRRICMQELRSTERSKVPRRCLADILAPLSGFAATRQHNSTHAIAVPLTLLIFRRVPVVRARDSSRRPSHMRWHREPRKWRPRHTTQETHEGTRDTTAHGHVSTEPERSLRHRFATDLITCTRTVLTTNDPPLVTFFLLSHARFTRLSSAPLCLPPTIYVLVARSSALSTEPRTSWPLSFLPLTLFYETTSTDLADASQQQQNTRTTSASRHHRHWQACQRWFINFPTLGTLFPLLLFRSTISSQVAVVDAFAFVRAATEMDSSNKFLFNDWYLEMFVLYRTF